MPDDFVEACDRIIVNDEWFPTIARIRSVSAECAHDRTRVADAIAGRVPSAERVCPICHGAHWVRYGGYDPMQMQAGDEGSRSQPCPGCTTGGKYHADHERNTIADQGGIPNPNARREPDMSRTTWRAPRLPDGRVDVDELYRESRRLRGLDPNVDARPMAVPGFKTIGRSAAMPEPALVGVGADDDDFPF